VVEPFVVHSSSPQLLAGYWAASRETTLAGIVPRAQKESVSPAVSKVNQCPYCVDAHTMMLMAAGNVRLPRRYARINLTEYRTSG
jgi:AhpD family alkylhydroperoxidase